MAYSAVDVSASVICTEVWRGPRRSDVSLDAVHDAGHRLALSAALLAIRWSREVLPTLTSIVLCRYKKTFIVLSELILSVF